MRKEGESGCLLTHDFHALSPYMLSYVFLQAHYVNIMCNVYFLVITLNRTFLDNDWIFFLISLQIICCGYSSEAPREALLMSTHNICFCVELRNHLS